MFYTYNQNNSGGKFRFVENRISHFVIIEAADGAEADERAQEIGIYFNGCADGRDCKCCGDRWYPSYDEGTEKPSVYGRPITESPLKIMTKRMVKNPKGFVHYKNGVVEPFGVD